MFRFSGPFYKLILITDIPHYLRKLYVSQTLHVYQYLESWLEKQDKLFGVTFDNFGSE